VRAPGEPYDDVLRPLLDAELEAVPSGTRWFDAHTHIGHDDPDGYEADPEQIGAGLDRAGHHRALLFARQEPAGYPPANDRVLDACARSGGRLSALARIDPNSPTAMDEARRTLDRGARGFKLHPRSDRFALPHPVVAELVALAGERRAPVLFHAGRGIPRLGEAVLDLARRHPGARLILAHAGISDVGWLAPAAAELPNLFFDTAWWQVGDLLALFAAVPPGRILYASDMPYGTGVFHSLATLRCARAVGLGPDAVAAIAGAQLERVVAGEDPIEAGPAPGADGLGARDPGFERVVAHLAVACTLCWRGADPTEQLGLARLACHRADGHPAAALVEDLAAASQEAVDAGPPRMADAAFGALGAQLIAGTPALSA
jgi:hypothetical protein